MKALFTFFTLMLALSVVAQPDESLYKASDFTPEHTFTSGIEGPASGKDGRIYLVNYQKEGTIGVIDREGKTSLFATLPNGSVGNGIRFGRNGDMFIADYTGHNILCIKKGTRIAKVFANEPLMNQPNDLAITSSGVLFASDPNWTANTGNVWRIGKEGKVTLLERDMGTTNGIEVSPDGVYLYVNESVQRRIWRYNLDKNGNISNKTLFYSFLDFGMDGMRCDVKGNLYVARHGKGTVAILSPGGVLLREVTLKGKLPSNIAFGGKDGKTCYITLQDRGCVEIFRSEFSGREW